MRHIRHANTALPILVGLALWVGGSAVSRAADGHSFIIAANDGYGIEDCLGEAGECGHVVADAWCAAHGHSAALSFGRADDITGTVAYSGPSKLGPSYFVTCGD
jgi:hypothetical protein